MTIINTGGPAYPGNVAFSAADDMATSENIGQSGMTLRDHFAATALQGFLASQYVSDFIKEVGKFSTDADVRRNLATNAYLYADAMLAAREVQP